MHRPWLALLERTEPPEKEELFLKLISSMRFELQSNVKGELNLKVRQPVVLMVCVP